MMGKAPAAQFYWNEWSRDLEEHPLEIEGAWMRICAKLWYSKEVRGKLTLTLDQWARVLRVDNSNAFRILSYLCHENVGDFPGSVTDKSNGLITIICRRMYREEKARIDNALRQQRLRDRRKSNGGITDKSNGNITPPSSSSPSSSKEEEEKEPRKNLSKEFIQEAAEPAIEETLEEVCQKLYTEKIFPEVYAFKTQAVKHKKNPRSILHTLSRCYLARPDDPWAYCKKIIDLENLNYNERDYQKTAR